MFRLNNKKICLICHPYYWKKDTGAGHDRYAYELITNMRKKMIAPLIMDSGFINVLSSEFKNSIPEGVIKELLFPFKLFGVKANIYHATSSVSARSPILDRKRPLVTTIHDLIPFSFRGGFDYGLKYMYKRYCIKLAAKKSDMIIVPFKSTKEKLMSLFRISPEKIRVIKYGIDHESFFPQRRDHNEIKKILFIGAVNRAKGVDSLIKAFSIIEKELRDVQLLIGSKGWDLKAMEELVNQLNLNHKVRFLGYIQEGELCNYYNLADVCVFPSRYGFGLPTLEAMACGTPTIAGATLDAIDFVEGDSILVDPDNIEQLATELVRVLTDKKLREQLSKKGLKKASAFSWEKMVEETIDIYKLFV